MSRELNWAENHTFAAARIHRPETIDEVRRLVAAARNIRAIGTRHSFNGLADSSGELVDLGALPPNVVVDRERMTATVAANTPYGVLAGLLQKSGVALHNMASLPHISLAGAISTGTHGSGDRNGTLSTAVAGLELVAAGGDLVTVRRGDEGFDGLVVGLGAFGVVTRLTLDVQPSFELRQDAFIDLPWQTVLDDFDAVFGAGYSVSLLTKWAGPAVDRMWIKTRVAGGEPREVTAAHFGATPVAAPTLAGNPAGGADLFYPFGGVPGPWSERLPHFRADGPPGPADQVQSEYMLPRTQAIPALKALRAIGRSIDPPLLATEIRTMAADELWLSPAYGHDTVAIHFSWHRGSPEIAAVSRRVEELLLPLGGRPHWGKVIHSDAGRLAPLYPRMPEFRALARRYDPAGKFRNAFLASHVSGAA